MINEQPMFNPRNDYISIYGKGKQGLKEDWRKAI